MIQIRHIPSGEIVARGKKGWDIFSFEGNYYISRKALVSRQFKFSWIPGLCPYKFLYFWYHYVPKSGTSSPFIAWKYWLPNPIFLFIAFRIAVPQKHPDLEIEK